MAVNDEVYLSLIYFAHIVSTVMSVATILVEGDDGFLDSILDQLCSLSDEAALKEGKAKGNSIFKLSTLKLIAKKSIF